MHQLLSKIDSAADLQKMSVGELTTLAAEIRDVLCNLLSTRTAHFASNLGVVELCAAETEQTWKWLRTRIKDSAPQALATS